MQKKPHKDDIRDEPPQARDELEKIAESAGRYARKMIDETQHMGETVDDLADAIREKPLKALLIAAGVGAVLGMLIRGK